MAHIFEKIIRGHYSVQIRTVSYRSSWASCPRMSSAKLQQISQLRSTSSSCSKSRSWSLVKAQRLSTIISECEGCRVSSRRADRLKQVASSRAEMGEVGLARKNFLKRLIVLRNTSSRQRILKLKSYTVRTADSSYSEVCPCAQHKSLSSAISYSIEIQERVVSSPSCATTNKCLCPRFLTVCLLAQCLLSLLTSQFVATRVFIPQTQLYYYRGTKLLLLGTILPIILMSMQPSPASPTFRRSLVSPNPKGRTHKSPSAKPSRPAPPTLSPPKLSPISSLFRQICCPNCRYLFKILKDQPSAQTKPILLDFSTQTSIVVTKDISTITKEIQQAFDAFGSMELPPPSELLSAIPQKQQSPLLPEFTVKKQDNNSGLKTQFQWKLYEQELVLKYVKKWIEGEFYREIPSYVKGILL